MYADTGDFQVHLPEERKTVYQDYVGKEVALGIRPENIHGAPYIPPKMVVLNAIVPHISKR